MEGPSSEKFFGAGRTPTCRNFGHFGFQKFRFFGQNQRFSTLATVHSPRISYTPPKTFFEGFGTPLVRAENFSTTPPQKGRFWGCRNFCKIAFFGLNSAVFDSGRPPEPQNGSVGIKNFLCGLWNPFGAVQKKFDIPAPKRSNLGVQKFLPNPF